ncbi:MAG: flagellar biosynthetic protein FliO [Polyangiaceae bacterium]
MKRTVRILASVIFMAAMGAAPAVASADVGGAGRNEPYPTSTPSADSRARSEGTPLSLRPNREESASLGGTSIGTKLLLVGLILGAAFLYFRTRRVNRGADGRPAPSVAPRVLGRTSIGVRSELLVVEVDGQRLLLGVTPSAISTLSLLSGDALAESLPTPAEESRRDLSKKEQAVFDSWPNEEPRSDLVSVKDSLTRLLEGARARQSQPQPQPQAPARMSLPEPIESDPLELEVDPRSEPPPRSQRTVASEAAPAKKPRAQKRTGRTTMNVEGQARGLVVLRTPESQP